MPKVHNLGSSGFERAACTHPILKVKTQPACQKSTIWVRTSCVPTTCPPPKRQKSNRVQQIREAGSGGRRPRSAPPRGACPQPVLKVNTQPSCQESTTLVRTHNLSTPKTPKANQSSGDVVRKTRFRRTKTAFGSPARRVPTSCLERCASKVHAHARSPQPRLERVRASRVPTTCCERLESQKSTPTPKVDQPRFEPQPRAHNLL